ncbi:hypothetical protein COV42_02785 [Candidatus Campbellbacteria bacterium CG11_big_fil_rev_8_21_14_0_20_44_21]|nr:MAG: hypothetical protein COV42_02785 [Candidatus Campbellbacteria bacterium CG11_big_fil_rev_8_21_14_0_20_44_21]
MWIIQKPLGGAEKKERGLPPAGCGINEELERFCLIKTQKSRRFRKNVFHKGSRLLGVGAEIVSQRKFFPKIRRNFGNIL